MNSAVMKAKLADPLEGFLGYQIRRISAAAMANLTTALAPEGVSPAIATVLLMIEANPGETQARIGRELSIKRANIAPMIAVLESAGLIRRDNHDGRSVGLACTAKGIKAARRVRKIVTEHEAQMFGALDPKAYAQLASALRLLRDKNRSIQKAG